MVKVNIQELLKRNKKSKYWLCQQMDIRLYNLNRIIKGETSSISFRYIEDFCKLLNCTPNELFTVSSDEKVFEKTI